MPCLGNGSTGAVVRNFPIVNWTRTRTYQPANHITPASVTQLAAAVRAAQTNGGVVRALGSYWSYGEVALTSEITHVIDTSVLNRILNGNNVESLATVFPHALNDSLRAEAANFIHVEAGIKIHALNCALQARGKAMATLGGSNGQSLAGAISTGTHGGDVNLRPIADQVRAVHLVGPGGQEWWIEGDYGGRSITSRERLEALRNAGRFCGDIRIVYDENLLDAVMVSAGRMGVIYAVVVEVVDRFRLEENRERVTWNVARSRIQNTIINAGDNYTGPRFMEVLVNPYANAPGQQPCVITTRDVTTDPRTGGGTGPDIFGFACNLDAMRPVLAAMSGFIPGLLAAALGVALAGISWMLAIPIIGPILFAAASTAAITAATAGLIAFQTVILRLLTAGGETITSNLVELINMASTVGQKQIVPDLINALMEAQRGTGGGRKVDDSFRIMTNQDACGEPWTDAAACLRQVDGIELALPATPRSTALFAFMDDVFALTREFYNMNQPQAFAMSMRFTRGTRALIGMQQFWITASVEFVMPRGIRGLEAFKQRLYVIARQRGAIPHWGQVNQLDAGEVQRLYGTHLSMWREQLQRLIVEGGGRPETFRTSFSMSRGLEPPASSMTRELREFSRRLQARIAKATGLERVT